MRTQSLDTSPAFEQIQIAHIRTFSAAKKFASTHSWTQSITSANLHCSSDSFDGEWQREQSVSFVNREYGEPLASLFLQALRQYSEWSMQAPDIQEAMLPLVDVALQLDVPALLIGSVAGSIYGFPRSVHDVDFMADFSPEHAPVLLERLAQCYVFDPRVVTTALQQHTSFSMLHLSRLIKVEVFLPSTNFDREVVERKQAHMLVEGSTPLLVASSEDVTLLNLLQYQARGGTADDRWNDILAILKVQAPVVDCAYLEQQATALDIEQVLSQALIDAGIRDEEPSFSQ